MVISNSITKKYTPPTCTLEVVAKSSLLSRWSQRPLMKDMQFELRFDDPRLPTEDQVTIKGDHLQLEMLYEAVDQYVQNFLSQSPLNGSPLLVPNLYNTSDSAPLNQSRVEETVVGEAESTPSQPNLVALSAKPHLQGSNLLVHQLFFGELATEASGTKVNLSASQLFDLANALDEYNREMAALPPLPQSQNRVIPVAWVSIAAVAVATVGLSLYFIRFNQQAQITADSSQNIEELETAQNPILSSEVESVSVPEAGGNFPIPSPTLPPSLSQESRLPPPPRVSAPPTPRNSPPANLPLTIQPSNSGRVSTITASPVDSSVSVKATSPASPPRVARNPNSNSDLASKNGSNFGSDSGITNEAPNLPPEDNGLSSSKVSAIIPEYPKIPDNLPSLNPDLPSANSDITSSPLITRAPENSLATEGENIISSQQENLPLASSEADNNDRLEVAVRKSTGTPVQVTQAVNYFESSWQPPAELDQVLQYRLLLRQDGSIRRIIPLGRASVDFISSTGMPVIGTPFVDSFSQENPQMQVLFYPDGSVEASLE